MEQRMHASEAAAAVSVQQAREIVERFNEQSTKNQYDMQRDHHIEQRLMMQVRALHLPNSNQEPQRAACTCLLLAFPPACRWYRHIVLHSNSTPINQYTRSSLLPHCAVKTIAHAILPFAGAALEAAGRFQHPAAGAGSGAHPPAGMCVSSLLETRNCCMILSRAVVLPALISCLSPHVRLPFLCWCHLTLAWCCGPAIAVCNLQSA